MSVALTALRIRGATLFLGNIIVSALWRRPRNQLAGVVPPRARIIFCWRDRYAVSITRNYLMVAKGT